MIPFAQHTRLIATPGNVERLVQKFLDASDIQRENPACIVMMVSRSLLDHNAVILTEVWTSEDEWDAARSSPRITAWTNDMPALVALPPDTERLLVVGGKGVA